MSARYWSPKFGTVLRHSTGQVVMLICPAGNGQPPPVARMMYLAGYVVGPSSLPGKMTAFAARSDMHTWQRIKKGTEE
jgi:hypothetical protein